MATIRKEGELNLSDLYKVYLKQGGLLSYNDYKKVVVAFIEEMMKKIITTGYRFSMPHYCGQLAVIQLERKYSIKENGNIRGAVDWKNSQRVKKEILERGGVPLVNEKDENNNIIGNNGGEEWMCYHTSPTYFSWAWTSHINMKNCLKYTFDITKYNSRNLSASINEDSYLLFKLRERNGTNKDYLNKILTARGASKIFPKQQQLAS